MTSKVSRHVENYIDEQCRILNMNGTSHGSALHLAQWMKGQFDDSIKRLTDSIEINQLPIDDENENMEEWSSERLRKRSEELQLVDGNGHYIISSINEHIVSLNTSDESRIGRDSILELDDGSKSASTTSDSQITVRSSPVAKKIDNISMCHHCHKNCKQRILKPKTSSLKVQHSQNSLRKGCKSASSSHSSQISSNNSRISINSKSKLITEDDVRSGTSSIKTITTNTCSNVTCMCRCSSKDFNANQTVQKMKKEACKLKDASEVSMTKRSHEIPIRESKISHTNDNDNLLIGNSESHVVADDTFNSVPKISIVPPTPDGFSSSEIKRNSINSSIWDSDNELNEISPEESPQEELPYRALNTTLKRYGTMSSLEKMPSEETEEITYDSSEADANDDDDIRIVTKEIYDSCSQTWTHRAGSFFEQSKAFIDTYLSRWDRGNENVDDEDETIHGEECISGATSGEEVWGTPTSGENDEMQMFNSDQTHSSSSSFSEDDDTELMMDELLMAPPMTASTIRGLLPRRRLEPLFEEDTESSSSESADDENEGGKCLTSNYSSSDQGYAANIHTSNGCDVGIKIDKHIASDIKKVSHIIQSEKIIKFGKYADVGCSVAPKLITVATIPRETSVDDIVPVVESSTINAIRLSPRLEMRLALNHEIMGDEDLIAFEPGPANLAEILGRDLLSYHRFTGKELITRSANRVGPKEAPISFLQQKNSKMDTPTPNRKKSNQNIWNNSASVAANIEKSSMSDLERLAQQERKVKMNQAKPQSTIHMEKIKGKKGRKIFGFLCKRESKTLIANGMISSKSSLPSSEKMFSTNPKDVDKFMDRRFWKHLSKRRRSLTINEFKNETVNGRGDNDVYSQS